VKSSGYTHTCDHSEDPPDCQHDETSHSVVECTSRHVLAIIICGTSTDGITGHDKIKNPSGRARREIPLKVGGREELGTGSIPPLSIRHLITRAIPTTGIPFLATYPRVTYLNIIRISHTIVACVPPAPSTVMEILVAYKHGSGATLSTHGKRPIREPASRGRLGWL
jgi:hypothetical protein